jgi:PIN domain nuclease of toxin-antitoxin system
MATLVHLDTHVVVWLYAGMLEKIPRRVQSLLNRARMAISPMVVLELEYLYEIGRLKVPAAVIVEDLQQRIGVSVSTAPFSSVAAAACKQSWTKDPFDRMIAAQAGLERADLVTADEVMQKHVEQWSW